MSRTDTIFVCKATTQAQREACLAIRRTVFVEEQKFSAETEVDEYDDRALHFLALHNQVPVGTIRIILKDQGATAKVTRVAVLKYARGLGIGKTLMRAVENVPEIQTVQLFVLHSQLHAIPFYQQCGYAVYGDEFLEDGAPHRKMRKENSHSIYATAAGAA